MLKVTVVPDLRAMQAQMRRIEREQLPFAVGTALTRTASFVAKKERDEIQKVFHVPTRFTLNAVKVKPASKRNLVAEVYVNEDKGKGTPAIDVLGHHIYGGPRKMKAAEKLLRNKGILLPGYWIVPGKGAAMTAAGNIRAGVMQRIISALDASFDAYTNSSYAAKGKRRPKNRLAGKIFAIRTKEGHLEPGVYERVGEFRLRPLLVFVRQPTYRKRWRFFEVAEAGGMRFRLEFALAMRQALRFARARG